MFGFSYRPHSTEPKPLGERLIDAYWLTFYKYDREEYMKEAVKELVAVARLIPDPLEPPSSSQEKTEVEHNHA